MQPIYLTKEEAAAAHPELADFYEGISKDEYNEILRKALISTYRDALETPEQKSARMRSSCCVDDLLAQFEKELGITGRLDDF